MVEENGAMDGAKVGEMDSFCDSLVQILLGGAAYSEMDLCDIEITRSYTSWLSNQHPHIITVGGH